MQQIKKGITGVIDWFLYTALTTKQKEYLSNLLSTKVKQKIKNTIKPGKKQAQMRRMEKVKYKLYNLGFLNDALKELEALYKQDKQPYIKRLAAWELALWHANQLTKSDARKCLAYLPTAIDGVTDRTMIRCAAILEAEGNRLLGDFQTAKQVISNALVSNKHPDLYLAMANLETDIFKRIDWINNVFLMMNEEKLSVDNRVNPENAYDVLGTARAVPAYNDKKKGPIPKVSIIIPVYNASPVIHTSLPSIQNQSWRNLEILVVDDCSTDDTYDILKTYAEDDPRISILQTAVNSGAYTARNTALRVATGDFVTVNDADDWSHPNKIKTQVSHLLENPKIIGNFSQQARAQNDLTFHRRGKPGQYIFSNMSSFMFRREPVMEKLGYWDSVRFAGDSEFIKRITRAFGEKSITTLNGAPLSFQRQSADSLTGDAVFGFPGFFMGARKEYDEAHEYFYQTQPKQLKYDFPMKERPFSVPEPMWPEREKIYNGRRHFDVVIVSEFRLSGGTNMSNIEEIKAQQQMGLKTGLVQLNRYHINPEHETNQQVRDVLDGDTVQMIVYGEKISCDVLIIRHPPILQYWQKYLPNIEADSVHVIANQTPKKEYTESGEILYELELTNTRVKEYFHKTPVWHPIGPLIRNVFHKEHTNELKNIQLAENDWFNIIDVTEWKRPFRPNNSVIKIGRHARDQYVKWPNTREELLNIYPDDPAYEVHILGGATVPEKLLGGLPDNWHVQAFGEVHPKDFLRELDVFLYYTHPGQVEAFGRVIFEAMAAGVPVIIPPSYRTLFGEAAIYATPYDVQQKVLTLMDDERKYAKQVETALAYVEKNFGYSKHASRLKECLHGKASNA